MSSHLAQSSLLYQHIKVTQARAHTWGPKKISTGRGIKSYFKVIIFARLHSVILCQVSVTKKHIYHTGNNYHFHANVNYIYCQS